MHASKNTEDWQICEGLEEGVCINSSRRVEGGADVTAILRSIIEGVKTLEREVIFMCLKLSSLTFYPLLTVLSLLWCSRPARRNGP